MEACFYYDGWLHAAVEKAHCFSPLLRHNFTLRFWFERDLEEYVFWVDTMVMFHFKSLVTCFIKKAESHD